MKHLNKCLCGLAIAGALVATDAYAETNWEGFEMRAALTAPIVDSHKKMSMEVMGMSVDSDFVHADDIFAGVGGTLSFGYRFGMFGVYIDQDLGGVWWQGDSGPEDGTFIGGTYLTGRLLLALRHDVELDFGIGLGTMYSGGDKNTTARIIVNKDGDHSAAFAIKAGFGLTYYLIPNTIGIGINFDYSLGVNIVSQEYEEDDEAVKASITNLVHLINPGIHVVAQF